jgi:hypothetical protein
MSLELKVLDRQEGKIIINYDEMKKQLALELNKYKGLVFSEEQITEAKKTRASLNKVAKAIDERRKEEKQAFMRGFEVFEAQTKELTKMVKDVSDEIDEQIKAFEENEKVEKKVQIQELWLDLGYDKIELKQIWDDKWFNKGCTLKQIEIEIKGIIDEIEEDLSSIDFLCSDDEEKATTIKTKYLVYLDKGRAINEYQQEQLAKQKISKVEVVEETKKEEAEPAPNLDKSEIYELTFKVYGNALELKTLSKFLKDNGYKYERLS